MQGFFVLDQNVMQRPALLDFLRQNPQANLVLPDTALVEMSKSEQWEHTFRRNLAPLRAHASRCFMSLSVQEAREIELLQGQSSHDQLLPEEFAQLLRGAIEGSQASEGNDTLAQIRATMPSLRADFEAHDLNAAAAKEELVTRVLEIRSKLTPQEMQACRDPQAGRLAKVIIARNIGDGIYQAYMESAGASIAFARQLVRAKLDHPLAGREGQFGGIDAAPNLTEFGGAILAVGRRAPNIGIEMQAGDGRSAPVTQVEREPAGLCIVGEIGAQPSLRHARRLGKRLVVVQPTAVGTALLAATEGGQGVIEKDAIGEKDQAEKGDQANEHMPAPDFIGEPGRSAHR